MPTFTWAPQYGAANEVKPSVLTASFGDGYEQRTKNGINNLPRSWSLTFYNTPTDADSIEGFLITPSIQRKTPSRFFCAMATLSLNSFTKSITTVLGLPLSSNTGTSFLLSSFQNPHHGLFLKYLEGLNEALFDFGLEVLGVGWVS